MSKGSVRFRGRKADKLYQVRQGNELPLERRRPEIAPSRAPFVPLQWRSPGLDVEDSIIKARIMVLAISCSHRSKCRPRHGHVLD